MTKFHGRSHDDYVIRTYSGLFSGCLEFTFTFTFTYPQSQMQMLRGVTRITLRRGVHTTSSPNSAVGPLRHRFAMAAGASVIAASYLGWRIHLESRGIALDSDGTRMIDFSLLSYSRTEALLATSKPTTHESRAQSSDTHSVPSSDTSESQADHIDQSGDDAPSEGDEASSRGAFDPVTGEINWDCPCLGGMAYGPCGMQFREAFSCFVYSKEDPQGIDCVEKFKAMQNCFRENPDVYGEGTQYSLECASLSSLANIFAQKL
jgi:intermembrane space import and assembly protein 40